MKIQDEHDFEYMVDNSNENESFSILIEDFIDIKDEDKEETKAEENDILLPEKSIEDIDDTFQIISTVGDETLTKSMVVDV